MSFEIIIDGKSLLYTTKFEVEDDFEPDTTTTHSGSIVTPPETGTYTVSIERATKVEYVDEAEVFAILEKCKTDPVTIVAVKKTVNGSIRWTYSNCVRSSFKTSVDENGQIEYTFELISEYQTIETFS